MSRGKTILSAVLACGLFSGVLSTSVMAQQQPEQQRGERGGDRGGDRGGRGNFDPAQMRQRMMDRMKEQLGASDDEWKVIGPKLEKVMEVRRNTAGGTGGFGFFGGGDRGGRGGDDRFRRGGDQPQSPVAQAAASLRTAVEDKSTSNEEIARRLTALREARSKAQGEVAKAQNELKELLTQRQEAQLVMAGMLE